jgi:hypothetical protein
VSAIRRKMAVGWAIAATLIVETVAMVLRFGFGLKSRDVLNEHVPALIHIHHMYVGFAMLLALPWVWRLPRVSGPILGLAVGLIVSGALHHFAVLPLTVGNTGWH